VANAREVHLVNKSLRKSDQNDARLLADIGRTNIELLRPISHRSEQAQSDLTKLRGRSALVDGRTQQINFVRGVLKTLGTRAPNCSPESFVTRMRSELPADLRAVVEPQLRVIASFTKEIAELDKQIERLCEEGYPQTALVRPIGGVGPVTALTFVLTIGDVSRFKNARDVAAYLGLVPGSRSSGASNPQLHITKRGDAGLRRLLVLCANYIMREGSVDCDLKRFGERIAGADGDRKRRKCAKVAVARKLAVLMLHLLKTGVQYDPLYLAKKRGEEEAA
jgi:transposase